MSRDPNKKGISAPFSDRGLVSFEMSLRDAFRGVTSFVEAAEDALEPAASLVPSPLRRRVKDALRRIEGHSKRLSVAPISIDDIAAAAVFVNGSDLGSASPQSFAAIFGFAWDHLSQDTNRPRNMVSELLLSSALSGLHLRKDQTAYQRGAELCLHVLDSRAIGAVPGLISDFGHESRASDEAALVAIFVWLLCDRAGDIPGEERLLDLAEALVMAMLDQSGSLADEPDRLAVMLETASRHI